jgi:hygromycin-B 7''-O-kinase
VEYSKRLGSLADGQFQAALDRFALGRFVRAEAIPFGLFGQNVFVTSTAGEYVLRGCPHAMWQFPTEHYFARELHEHTQTPVPWPYLLEPETGVFGWSYAILPRMPGVNVNAAETKLRLTPAIRLAMARAMAETLVEMQRLKSPIAGRFNCAAGSPQEFDLVTEISWPFPIPKDAGRSRTLTHPEHIETVIGALLARSRSLNERTTSADVAWIEDIASVAHDALRVPFTPCFVMGDYQHGNVVFDDSSGRWRVSGLFDLMTAHFGDGECDLSRPIAGYLDEDPALAREFIQKYRAMSPPRAGFPERFRIYMLLERLTIWDYVQRHETQAARKMGSFRDWAERYVEALITIA